MPMETSAQPQAGTELVLVTGVSGSGKSVALHALEDAGYFCVDNLPPQLLRDFLRLEHERATPKVAVAVDVRSTSSLPDLLPLVLELKREGVGIRPIFLDASTEALVRRFSESRRPHPLSGRGQGTDESRALVEAIELERSILADLREACTVVDTSLLRPAQLRGRLRDLVGMNSKALTLVFESFAYKHGVPLDADFVFDMRALPNPFYDRELRPLTGLDAPVAQFLGSAPEVGRMLEHIETFLQHWLPHFESDQRSYLTVALGCTGGQHRSPFAAKELSQRFSHRHGTLVRHRELDLTD